MQPLKLSRADLIACEKELCKRSLVEFIKRAWHVLEPGNPYIHGWHVDALAEHYEAVTSGEINRMVVNIPPGCMKSSIANIYWPAWEWGPKGMAHIKFIGASHERGLAIRDSRLMRILIESDWYQERWPTKLNHDQNEKLFYGNAANGFRMAAAVKSTTGRRADRVVWDDPLSISGGLSKVDRDSAILTLTETLPTRVISPEKSFIGLIMQRIHEEDPSGYILEHLPDWVHLCLPMEYDPSRAKTTVIGFKDPRTEEGELLFPERFPREVVERDKNVMGSYAVAGQFQQTPMPRNNGFFDWEKLEIVRAAPEIARPVRYWDKAGTQDGGCRTAGVKLGICPNGVVYILDVVIGQWSAAKREAVILQTAQTDGRDTTIWIEEEGGSGGKESAEATIKNLTGFVCKSDRPTGDKEVRAEPYAVQVEIGNVKLVEGAWNKEYIDEHKSFPRGKFKDQIDATAGAFAKVSRRKTAGVF